MSDATLPRLQAVPNFRDVGGHETRDGRRVRGGLLYRSVVLDTATADDMRTLADLGIRTVFDLRTESERSHRPEQVPPGAVHVPLDLLADRGESDPLAYFELMQDPPRASVELAGGGAERFYLASYRDLVRVPSARSGYARLWRTLADADARPALVHCTAGKDRTGWAVASLLLWLGVGREAVLRDYLTSDGEVMRAYGAYFDDFVERGGSLEVAEPMLRVQARYLDEAIATMQADHGSIEGYVHHGLGLEVEVTEALREAFLEP
ncbi:MAG: tyrosine-protein phosphatase [Candidatus Limnocylindrales bacterium]